VRKIKFEITLSLADTGKVDQELLEANINHLIQRGVDEGIITPDQDNHAALLDVDILPCGYVE
jgi:hypothetical protein